ncbi:MAG TPA: hypothetical protein VN317_02685 [Candidatus Methanoperedens sp.]|nr:hypothetical protein [Candidatus Methanoperedens sp.]
MRRVQAGFGAVSGALLAALLGAAPAAAQEGQLVETSIDLNYTYEQKHAGPDVTAATGYQQKYQVRLATTLTSSLDFLGAVSLDLDDKWSTDAATTSKVSPSLELGVRGPQSGAKLTYTGSVNRTEQYHETSGATQYSNSADLDLELTPDFWPELKFKLQERRDYQRQRTDSSSRSLELQLRDELLNVRAEFSLKLGTTIETLPVHGVSDTVDWSWKATYKEELFGGVDFEVAYELKESYGEDTVRSVFSGQSETYTQTLKTRLKKSLELSPRLNAGVTWEYSYDQDLLQLEYDYKVQNKYGLDARFNVLPSLKVTGEAKRETELEAALPGAEDTRQVTDTFKAAFDFEPVRWLRLGGKTERKFEQAIKEHTGGSVDLSDDEQYELTAKNKFGDFWDLAASTSGTWSYANGWLEGREAKLKAELRLRLLKLSWSEMNVTPSYESSRKSSWDEFALLTEQTSTSEAKVKVEVKAVLLELLKASFSHEYGQKITRELDEVLNFSRELGFNESTRFNLGLNKPWEGFTVEGEFERKADDTEGDAEGEVVELSYSLKLDWKIEMLSLSSAFKYSDKGDDDDDLEFTAKVGWKGERIDVSGDYQFTKSYADLTDEGRKLNLKLSYKF